MFIRLYAPDLYKGFHGTKTMGKSQEKKCIQNELIFAIVQLLHFCRKKEFFFFFKFKWPKKISAS